MAALGAVAEKVGFWSPITWAKPAEISSLKLQRGCEEAAASFEKFPEEASCG